MLIRHRCHHGPSWPSIRDLDFGLLALADPLGFAVTAALEQSLDFESDPAHVRLARSFVARTLREWKLGALVDDAQLVVSELASNAVLHARGEVRVRLRSDGKFWVRIELRDDNPRLPVPVAFSHDATSGRGLSIVDAVSTSWGVGCQGGGKTVWAELAVGHAHAFAPECLEARDVESPVT